MDILNRYEEIIVNSGIALPGLAKGTLFIGPKGWHIWESFKGSMDRKFRSIGVRNVSFPSFIPLSEMEKEKKSLEAFNPEMFLVSRSIDKDKSPFVCLRPTSEILFSHFFKKNLHSHEDLPILLNQWCNVYRSEKNTKAFLRSCEFHWQEAHTLHRLPEEALEYLEKFHEIYRSTIKDLLCLSFLEGEKTVNERFPGSEKTLAIEAIMPDGQALQIATTHYLSTNFSSIFQVKYSDNTNTLRNPHQLSAGSSTRLLGALILGHSDSKGLVLPWDLADTQIKVLVINEAVKEGDVVHGTISEAMEEYSFHWEFSSKKSFGFRMSEAEVAGIPVVIAIGKKELEAKEVMVKSRIDPEKKMVNLSQLKLYLSELRRHYSKELYSRSSENLKNMVVDLSTGASLEKVKHAVLKDKKIVLVPWLDMESNESKFKSESLGFGPRCIKSRIAEGSNVRCFYSGAAANSYVYFGRSY